MAMCVVRQHDDSFVADCIGLFGQVDSRLDLRRHSRLGSMLDSSSAAHFGGFSDDQNDLFDSKKSKALSLSSMKILAIAR